MNTVPEFDLLAEVRQYISTATPEEVRRDLLLSEFEAFKGVGNSVNGEVVVSPSAAKPAAISPVVSYCSGITWSSAPAAGLTFVNTLPYQSLKFEGVLFDKAGKTEEAPLAA